MSKIIELHSNIVFQSIHRCEKRYIIMKGSAGSGKSVDTAQQYILRLMSEKGNYMNPEQLEHIFYDLKSLVSKLEASDKSAHKRIDRIEGNIDAIHTLALSVQQIATETKNMREDLDGAIKKLTELETKPVRKWDNLIHYILSAIIGAAVAYFFAKL